MARGCFCNDRRNDCGCQLSGGQNVQFRWGDFLELGMEDKGRSSFRHPKGERYQFKVEVRHLGWSSKPTRPASEPDAVGR